MRWSSSSSLIAAVRPARRRFSSARVEVERLGPERLERRPLFELVRAHQVERTEPPRIVEREPPPLLGLDDEMVVLADLARVDPPVAGHSEMEDQRVAAVGVDQSIFGASSEGRSPERRSGAGRDRPAALAEVRPPRFDPLDPPAFEHSGKPANGGFDFGKLGHRFVIAGSEATKQSAMRRLDCFAALAMTKTPR